MEEGAALSVAAAAGLFFFLGLGGSGLPNNESKKPTLTIPFLSALEV